MERQLNFGNNYAVMKAILAVQPEKTFSNGFRG